MKRLAAMLVVLFAACLLSSRSATADPTVFDYGKVLDRVHGSITIPQEWDGVWTVVDSLYLCAGGFLQTFTQDDTLCAGTIYAQTPPGTTVPFVCTGTADATTIDVTCNGSFVPFPDCKATIDVHTTGTRTAGSYVMTSVMNSTYAGTGEGCDLLPPSCTRIVSRGTRTGPAPLDCATPARPSTWGQVKVRYR